MKLTKGRIYKLLSTNKQTRKQINSKLYIDKSRHYTEKKRKQFNLRYKTLKHSS